MSTQVDLKLGSYAQFAPGMPCERFSEKIRFEFLYVHDLGPSSRNDLDLQYSDTFIMSFSCLYLPTFRSQASTVSEKLTVFTFSYRKALVSKFDLAVKKVKVTPVSNYDGLESPMLHTKFRENPPASSGEEDF